MTSLLGLIALLLALALTGGVTSARAQDTFTLDQYGNLTAQPQAIVATPGCFSPNTLGLLGMTKPWDCRGFGELQPAPECVDDPRRVGCFGYRTCTPNIAGGSVSCVVAYNPALLAYMYIGIKNMAQIRAGYGLIALANLRKLANATTSKAMRDEALKQIKVVDAKQVADMEIMVDPPDFHIAVAIPWAPVYVPTTEGGPDAPVAAIPGLLGAVQASYLTKALAAEARYAAYTDKAVKALEKANASKINCANLRRQPPVAIPPDYDPPEIIAEFWAHESDIALANARYEGESALASWTKVAFQGQAAIDMKPVLLQMRKMTYTDLPRLVCTATTCGPETMPTLAAVVAAPLQNCQ